MDLGLLGRGFQVTYFHQVTNIIYIYSVGYKEKSAILVNSFGFGFCNFARNKEEGIVYYLFH